MGGLARLATVVEKMRKDADGVLLVDAGDSLYGAQVLPQQKTRRAKLIVDAYSVMGMDAMALGEQDRAAGLDAGALRRIRDGTVVTRAGVKMGVFSADLDAKPQPTLGKLEMHARSLRARGAKLVVALIHCGSGKVQPLLAPGGAGIDIAVVSHSAPYADAVPQRVGGTWVVETPPQAKQVGRLDLHIVDGKLDFVDVGGRAQMESRLADSQRDLAGLAARFGSATGEMHDFYLRHKAELERSIEAQKKVLAGGSGQTAVKVSWIENQFVPLGAEVPDSPRIAPLIKKYKDDVAVPGAPVAAPSFGPFNNNVPANAAPATPQPAAALPAPGAAPSPPLGSHGSEVMRYAGGMACKRCHEAAYAFWTGTKHAKAWQTLVTAKQERDPACILCHVTANLLSMPDVQCEACHGRGASHSEKPDVKGLIARDTQDATCTSCHRPPQAKEFEYKSFRASILGPGHGQK